LTVSSALFDGSVTVVDKRTGKRVPFERDGREITITTSAGHTYLLRAG
jgi:hypothetical protein